MISVDYCGLQACYCLRAALGLSYPSGAVYARLALADNPRLP